jgi:hypothetical protein
LLKIVISLIDTQLVFFFAHIWDRVRSGLASARAKGKVLELARVAADTATITSVRAAGRSWTAIEVELGI